MKTKCTENLTEEFIEKLKPEEKTYGVKDAKTSYLFIRVSPKGLKTYSVIKKTKGRFVCVTVGKHPDVKLKDAREKAALICGNLKDAVQKSKSKKEKLILRDFFYNYYIEQYAEKYTKARTVRENKSIYERRFERLWGNKEISDISRDDVEKLHTAIKKKDGVFAANKALTLIKHILNKAVEWHHLPFNPVMGVKKYTVKSRERFIQPSEVPAFFKAISEEPNPLHRNYILLSLYTGQRRANILSMAWNDIDLTNKIWHISETKNGIPLNVPLIPQALDILKEMAQSKKGKWVFPSETSASGHIAQPQKIWERLLARADLKNLRIHDIRRTLGSYEAMAGVSLPLISRTLGHSCYQSTQVYARLHVDSVRDAMESAISLMEERAQEAMDNI